MGKSARKKIWIDLDNSPHVPFFIPIVRELEKNGHSVFLTTRDCFQVCSLADYFKLDHKKIGRHYGANKAAKVIGTLWRSLQLAPIVLRERPDLSVSHGSRSLVILSSFLRIPSVLLFDYEHAKILPFFKADLGIAPEIISSSELKARFKRGMSAYHGLKEDVYVPSFEPDPTIVQKLNLADDDIVVTIRPPATEAHYHNPDSDKLFLEIVEFLGSKPHVRMIVLPRNEKTQRDLVYRTWPNWCQEGKIIVPREVLNGLDLIWHSDLVISGGGTMNREAAALGVPVYSIFRGKLGAVDKYLAEQGRLTLIESMEDARTKIQVLKRSKGLGVPQQGSALLEIVASIEGMCNDVRAN
jgi:predicted glycosyltransferase